MEQIPGSDLRIPGFAWVVRPDGALGTSPPGRLAVFHGRRWYGLEVDSTTVRQAFLKPLRAERRMLDEVERLYAERGSEPAARPAPPKPELAKAEHTRWQRDPIIRAIKSFYPLDGIRPKGISIAMLTDRINKLSEFKAREVSEDTVRRADIEIEAARKK